MVCKKCGKEFTNDTNVCPFCNEDNKVEEVVATPTEAAPAEVKAEETAPAVENLVEETVTPAAPVVEDLITEEEKPAEPVVEDLVIEEPAAPAETPVEAVVEEAKPEETPATEATTEEVKEEAPVVEAAVIDSSVASPTEEEYVSTEKKITPRTIFLGILIVVLAVIAVLMYI